jgi:hypothetical protein
MPSTMRPTTFSMSSGCGVPCDSCLIEAHVRFQRPLEGKKMEVFGYTLRVERSRRRMRNPQTAQRHMIRSTRDLG